MKKIIKSILSRYLIFLTVKKNNNIIKRKIIFLKNNNNYKQYPINKVNPLIQNYSFYRKSDLNYLNFFYSISGIASSEYISLPIYYNIIEPVLNNISLLRAIKDKNFLDLYLEGINTPKTYIRKINNGFYNLSFKPFLLNEFNLNEVLKESNRVIIKPSIDSGAGKSIKLFKKKIDRFYDVEGNELTRNYLINYPDFVLQEAIIQHDFFKMFNPVSNNTIRILTYRSIKDEQLHILHRLLRIGAKGQFLDHDNHGGIAVGISNKGNLNDFGCSILGEKFESFNHVNFQEISGIPFLNEMEDIVRTIGSKLFYGRILAYDFTVDQSGTVYLLEINAWKNGISQYQMNNGTLFGPFTREILDYCSFQDYKHNIII